jgi:sulfur transfer complex TusBCD TusB component (DsrH family)
MPLLLNDMPLERANQILRHPIHQDGVGTLVQMITALRQCRSAEDYYHFQQDLLARVLGIQEHRAGCRRVAKLLRQGKAVLANAPELRSTNPVNNPETWELEADVCERVDRQLRSVADALAWRAFSYDRRVIIALSRNQHPGPMVGKKGLAAERAFVIDWWRDERRFVLLHDLTSCLSIGDATSFKEIGNDYEAYLHEIKSDPNRTVSRQARRKRMAEEAIRSGGPLPGDLPGRLVPLDIPYKTHLKLLGTAFDLAHERGVQGVKVPGGRALVATDIVRGYELWSERELIDRTAAEHLQAVKRAQILDVGHLVYARSDDLVARSPTMPPWAIYPLSPELCARLITDYAMYFVTMSSEPLLAALDDVDLAAEWVLSRDQETVQPDEVVLRTRKGARTIELRWAEMQRRLLLEMADLPTWAEGVAQLMDRNDSGRHPWQSFAQEWKVWA